MQDFISECRARGYFHQCTDEDALRELMAKDTITAYIGFDCTAPSLHVGSLLQIMMLRLLQKCGHRPIVLMGGGTTKIGDPSGKDESRTMLSDAAIQANMEGIKGVFEKFLVFEDNTRHPRESGDLKIPASAGMTPNNKAIMVNNDDWLKEINYIEFLRDYGRHFSVNRMMTMESVRQRLERESHLSFLEFNYMILQAYDFVELNKRLNCRLQIGGSDQWGNIVMGVDLNRRLYEEEQVAVMDEAIEEEYFQQKSAKYLFGLTSPLITTASGAKMGKTAEGAVWLSEEKLSAYDYWQFWRNTEDADVGRFLRMFTELPLEEIEELEKAEGAAINDVKKRLATEATTLLHGKDKAEAAAETARKTFELGGVGEALPEISIAKSELESGIPAFKLLQEAGLAKSGKEARQKIREKAGKVNDIAIEDENQPIGLNDITEEGHIKLSVGKKRHALVKTA